MVEFIATVIVPVRKVSIVLLGSQIHLLSLGCGWCIGLSSLVGSDSLLACCNLSIEIVFFSALLHHVDVTIFVLLKTTLLVGIKLSWCHKLGRVGKFMLRCVNLKTHWLRGCHYLGSLGSLHFVVLLPREILVSGILRLHSERRGHKAVALVLWWCHLAIHQVINESLSATSLDFLLIVLPSVDYQRPCSSIHQPWNCCTCAWVIWKCASKLDRFVEIYLVRLHCLVHHNRLFQTLTNLRVFSSFLCQFYSHWGSRIRLLLEESLSIWSALRLEKVYSHSRTTTIVLGVLILIVKSDDSVGFLHFRVFGHGSFILFLKEGICPYFSSLAKITVALRA